MFDQIEINPEFQRALEVMENSSGNLFITGEAGTGKSTLLELWRSRTEKRVVTLAPTGVAALNVRGQTIHSFFKWAPDVTPKKVLREKVSKNLASLLDKLDVIVIDEVSMVRADLMDCIDVFLRRQRKENYRPFGGVRMIFVGDLYQLSPVVTADQEETFRENYVTPFFFSAHVFSGQGTLFDGSGAGLDAVRRSPAADRAKWDGFETIELKKIYRQADVDFKRTLNAVRCGRLDPDDLDYLNSRHDPDFQMDPDDCWIYLTCTNAEAEQINEAHLRRLPDAVRQYQSSQTGQVPPESFPTLKNLRLKVGSQVMFVQNDSARRWVNGSVGQIIGFERREGNGPDVIIVRLAGGRDELGEEREVEVEPYTWEVVNWRYDSKSKDIEAEVIGTFKQYPLRLAWGITIHKSQGKTFDRVVVVLPRAPFAAGQLYVALSRCRSLAGLVLTHPIRPDYARTNFQVVEFMTGQKPAESLPALADRKTLGEKRALIKAAIDIEGGLEILYQAKADAAPVRMTVKPVEIGNMEFRKKTYLGFRAVCPGQGRERNFRIDRVMDVAVLETVKIE